MIYEVDTHVTSGSNKCYSWIRPASPDRKSGTTYFKNGGFVDVQVFNTLPEALAYGLEWLQQSWAFYRFTADENGLYFVIREEKEWEVKNESNVL